MKPYYYCDKVLINTFEFSNSKPNAMPNQALELLYHAKVTKPNITRKDILEILSKQPETMEFQYDAVAPDFLNKLTLPFLIQNACPYIEWYPIKGKDFKCIKVVANITRLIALHYAEYGVWVTRKAMKAAIKTRTPTVRTGHQLAMSLDSRIEKLRNSYDIKKFIK